MARWDRFGKKNSKTKFSAPLGYFFYFLFFNLLGLGTEWGPHLRGPRGFKFRNRERHGKTWLDDNDPIECQTLIMEVY